MRTLIDSSSQRIIKIVEILIFDADWITMKKLAELIHANERTVNDDLMILKEKWGTLLGIRTSKKLGIKISNKNISSLGMIFHDIFTETLSLRWLEMLFLYPYQPIDFYTERLYSSASSLYRLQKKTNTVLEKIGIKIHYSKNNYYIESTNEYYVRNFFTIFFIELYGSDLHKLPHKLDLSIIEALVNEDWLKADAMTNEFQHSFMTIQYLVSLIRENQGFYLNDPISTLIDFKSQYSRSIRQKFPTLNSRNIAAIHHSLLKRISGWDSEAEKKMLQQATSLFYDQIISALEISTTLEKKQQFQQAFFKLYFSCKVYPFKNSILYNRIDYFAMSFKKTNPYVYGLLQEQLTILEKDISFDLNVMFSSILYLMCLIHPELSRCSGKIKKAIIISDFGMIHANYLATFFDNFFNGHENKSLNIEVTTYAKFLKQKTPLKFDLIITNVPSIKVKQGHVILVDDFPSCNNLTALYKAIQSARTRESKSKDEKT